MKSLSVGGWGRGLGKSPGVSRQGWKIEIPLSPVGSPSCQLPWLLSWLPASPSPLHPSIPPSSSYSSFYSIFLRPPPLASLLNWLGFLSTQTLSVLLFSTTTFLFSSTCGSRGFEIKQAKQAKQNNTEKANKSHLSCSETYLQAAHYVQQIDNVMGIVFFFKWINR